MKNSLDKIEKKLQILFESSINPLSNVDYSHVVIHELIDSLEKSTFTKPDGTLSAAHVYTIKVSPEMLSVWQKKQGILDQLSRELMSAAEENGIKFSYTPVIRLVEDENLKTEQISISASITSEAVGQTSAINLNTDDDTTIQPGFPIRAFLIRDGSKTIQINQKTFNIGRRPDNHLVLEDPRVSRVHAQIRVRQNKFILFDLNSMGGTFVNGQRVYQHQLKPGDVITLAGVSIIYNEEYQTNIQDTGGYTTTLDFSNPSEKIEE
jgi:hypothetical protein